ncbi:MAG: hypothetical protein ABSG84_13290 [Acidobacteriaceae bacterium]|jgi:hypothetical protein
MPERTAAEALLALFAGPARAAAILGDLTEMAATRGRLWFWTAYVRALISLGWRTPVAFVVTYAYLHSLWVMTAIRSSMHWLFRWVPYASPGYERPAWDLHLIPLLGLLTGLYILVPFLLVRFGLRDHLTQLASVLLLVSLPEFSSRLLVAVPVEALTAIAVLVALCLRRWRRPMIVLALSLAPRYAFFVAAGHGYMTGHLFGLLSYNATFVVTAVLCLSLHRWLLQNAQPTSPVQLAGAAHA